MSFHHVHQALESPLPKHLKLAAVVLAEFADLDTGECWPSIETISRRCSSDPRTAQRNIRELEELGVVERVGKHRTGTWKYRLIFPDSWGVAFCRGDMGVTEGGDTGVTEGVTPTPPEPSLNHQGNRHKRNTAKKSGSRECPQDFIPSDRTVELIREHHPTLNDADLQQALSDMKAHAYEKPRKDWNATYRNWVNNAVKFGHIGAGNAKTRKRPTTFDEIRAEQERAIRDAERREGGKGVVASY